MNINKWISLNTVSLKGKTIAVTGSYGGIFSKTAKILANLGANFIFLNRNLNKTTNQILELKKINPEIKVEFLCCDLSNFKQVKVAVNTLKQKQIDILFLFIFLFDREKPLFSFLVLIYIGFYLKLLNKIVFELIIQLHTDALSTFALI